MRYFQGRTLDPKKMSRVQLKAAAEHIQVN